MTEQYIILIALGLNKEDLNFCVRVTTIAVGQLRTARLSVKWQLSTCFKSHKYQTLKRTPFRNQARSPSQGCFFPRQAGIHFDILPFHFPFRCNYVIFTFVCLKMANRGKFYVILYYLFKNDVLLPLPTAAHTPFFFVWGVGGGGSKHLFFFLCSLAGLTVLRLFIYSWISL